MALNRRSGQLPNLEQLDMDNRDDVAGPYQGGSWHKGRGSAREIYGGPKHCGDPIGLPSSADLPPAGPKPAPVGHRHVWDDDGDDDPIFGVGARCLICSHRR